MQPTIEDLRIAYRRTNLRRSNVTFMQALESPMFAKCLTRLAENALKKSMAAGIPAPTVLDHSEQTK